MNKIWYKINNYYFFFFGGREGGEKDNNDWEVKCGMHFDKMWNFPPEGVETANVKCSAKVPV